MPRADGRGDENAFRSESSSELADSQSGSRYVIQHVVGDNHVKRPAAKGQQLSIGFTACGHLKNSRYSVESGVHHARRKIGECESKANRKLGGSLAPQPTWAATNLQDLSVSGPFDLASHPGKPAHFCGPILGVEVSPGRQPGRVSVLSITQVALVSVSELVLLHVSRS